MKGVETGAFSSAFVVATTQEVLVTGYDGEPSGMTRTIRWAQMLTRIPRRK